MSKRQTRTIDRLSALRGIALLSVCMLVAATSATADEFSFAMKPMTAAAPMAEWQGAGSVKFYQGHFLPELQHELSKIGPLALTDAGNQPISEHVLYDDYTKQARRRMERATQDSLQDYLLETTSLGKLEELFSSKSGPGTRRPGDGDVSLGLGISSGLPHVEVRYKFFTASLRVSIGARGDAKIDFKTRQMDRTHLVTRYSPRNGEFGLACRFGF